MELQDSESRQLTHSTNGTSAFRSGG